MKNLKKFAAFGIAAAMTVSMGVSAFADTYTPNTPANTTGDYTAPSDTVQESIKLSSVNFMNDGEQYTVVLFKVDTNTDGSVNIESANRTLVADDLLYINQGTKNEAFWVTDGMGPKGTKLADGTYILRIGGESLTQVYEVAVKVQGETILYGDVYKDGAVNRRDMMQLNKVIGKTLDESEVWFEAADLFKDGKLNTRDKMLLNKLLGKTIGQEDLPQTK